MTRQRLKNSCHRSIAEASDPGKIQDKRKFSAQMTQHRQQAVKAWYLKGGSWFLDWVKAHYRNWSGESLRWDDPFSEEFFLLLGNPWIETVIVEKSGQIGWTEAAIALNAFVLACLRVPVAFGCEQERKLGDIVGPRVQTAFDHCEPIQRLRMSYLEGVGRKDTDTKQRQITVGGVVSTYFYASTASKGGANNPAQARQASSALSSFTAYVILADEIELWPLGALDVARQRQEASWLPTKPIRAGSTPGHKGGVVDTLVRGSKYLFQWQVVCTQCGRSQFLDAFGNLLRPVAVDENGIVEDRYLDVMGKPLDWFYEDESDKAGTAFIGCQHCEYELERTAIDAGMFICVNTNVKLLDLLASSVKSRIPVREDVALRLPKLATKNFNAPERIRRLITTRNPADEIQQGLGKAVSIGGGRIDLRRLLDCVGRKVPEDMDSLETCIVVGVDQGRAYNYAVVQKWWLSENEDPDKRWSEAFVELLWFGEVIGGFQGITDLAFKWKADLVGTDSEPEVEKAGDFARSFPFGRYDTEGEFKVLLFDQVNLATGQKFRKVKQLIQGVETPMFRIHRTAGLDAVRDRVYRQLYRFPEHCVYEPGNRFNFLYHHQTSDRGSDGRWGEPAGEPDHYFHAMNFAEMSVLVNLLEHPPSIVFGTLNVGS